MFHHVSTSCQETVANILTAYYMVLTTWMEAMEGGSRWQERFFPIQTIRNLLDLCAHAVQSAVFWPSELTWRPRSRQEQCIEGFFGQLKQKCTGSPTLKDCLYSQCMLHMDQLRHAEMFEGFKSGAPPPIISEDDLSAMAAQALQDACCLTAWISVDKTAAEVKDALSCWWSAKGHDLVTNRFSSTAADFEAADDSHGNVFFEDNELDELDLEEGEIELCKNWQDRYGMIWTDMI